MQARAQDSLGEEVLHDFLKSTCYFLAPKYIYNEVLGKREVGTEVGRISSLGNCMNFDPPGEGGSPSIPSCVRP